MMMVHNVFFKYMMTGKKKMMMNFWSDFKKVLDKERKKICFLCQHFFFCRMREKKLNVIRGYSFFSKIKNIAMLGLCRSNVDGVEFATKREFNVAYPIQNNV